jgi:hypothetical protein
MAPKRRRYGGGVGKRGECSGVCVHEVQTGMRWAWPPGSRTAKRGDAPWTRFARLIVLEAFGVSPCGLFLRVVRVGLTKKASGKLKGPNLAK